MERITPFARTRTFLTVREAPRPRKSGPVLFLNGSGGTARHRPLDHTQSCSQIAPFVGLTKWQAGRILRSLSGRGCNTLSREPRAARALRRTLAPSLSCRKTFEDAMYWYARRVFLRRKTHGEL